MRRANVSVSPVGLIGGAQCNARGVRSPPWDRSLETLGATGGRVLGALA